MLHRAKGVKLLPYLVDTLPEQDDAVRRIQAPDEPYPEEIWFEPKLIIHCGHSDSLTAKIAAVKTLADVLCR